MYNVQNYIHKMEELKEFDFPFERFKRIEEKKQEESKEEPKIEEIKDEPQNEGDDIVKKLTTPASTIRLDEVQEGDGGVSTDKAGERRLLKAFSVLNVHFHFLAEPDI